MQLNLTRKCKSTKQVGHRRKTIASSTKIFPNQSSPRYILNFFLSLVPTVDRSHFYVPLSWWVNDFRNNIRVMVDDEIVTLPFRVAAYLEL